MLLNFFEKYDVYIDTSVDTVFTLLTNIEFWADWTTGIDNVEMLSGGAFGEGSRFNLCDRYMLTNIVTPCTVTEYAIGSCFVFKTDDHDIEYRYEMHDIAGGTRLTLEMQGRVVGLASVKLTMRLQHMIDSSREFLGSLKQMAETGSLDESSA